MRLDPPTAGTVVPVVRPGDMPDDPVQYRFVPEAPLQPNAAYRLIVSGRARPRRPAARDAHPRGPDRVRLRPSSASGPPPTPERRPRRRDLGPVHRPDGSPEHRPRRDRRDRRPAGARERSAGPSRTRSSSSSPRRRCRMPRRCSVDVAAGARNLAGAPLAAATHGTFRTVAKGDTPAPTGSDRRPLRCRDRRRQGRRWRELGSGRDLLPRADELHPDGRLGHLRLVTATAPAGGRSRRSSSTAGSARRSAGRTPSVSRPATTAATSSVAGRTTGCDARATRTTRGPRTSAADRVAP